MTNVSGTRSDAQASRTQQRPQGGDPQRTAKPDDVRAMSDAFAAARGKMTLDPFAGKPGGKQAPGKPVIVKLPLAGAEAKPDANAAALVAAFERSGVERQQSERFADGQGLALGAPPSPLAPPPIQIVNMPSPQVDPSAFAQMLADLWVRESGRGSKEVRVRFGADAWPATGAVLAQSADGLLDVAVELGDPRGGSAAQALRDALASRGLALGTVTAG